MAKQKLVRELYSRSIPQTGCWQTGALKGPEQEGGGCGGGGAVLIGERILCSWEEKWQEQKTTIVTTYSGNETLPEQLWA
jgi:hypothetical protein